MGRPDRDLDWNTRPLRGAAERQTKARLYEVRRAGLSAEEVTGSEHWDFFLSVVKEAIEKKQGQLEGALENLKTSDDFTTSEVINQKLGVRLLGREIEALKWVIELPKQLMEQGDQATELLGSIDESSD
jgi:hypothetical protein